VTTDGGELTLVPGDIDYLGIGNLISGDIVTGSTTPLDDVQFEDPDTIIGLFTSGESKDCEGDDAPNNELDNPTTSALGSLCRFLIDSTGTWYVGVTGFSLQSDSHPFAQVVTGWVVPCNARLVNRRARRLPDDQDSCLKGQTHKGRGRVGDERRTLCSCARPEGGWRVT
jgi:hypothetical protein